jgi:predicted DsbA family dithiol-disulfide isomerase
MVANIRIFSDFTCPFCYLGTGIIEKLKGEHDIHEEWIGYELHPEVPEEGVLLAEKFPDYDLDALFEELRGKGAPYGYEFGDVTLLSNIRMALEASEYARDHGKHDVFHAAVFRAYFTEARDIGQVPVIMDIAGQIGLDADELSKALREHRYEDRLRKGREEGESNNVSVLPTFVFNSGEKIVGLRSIETFRRMITGLRRTAGGVGPNFSSRQ